MICPRCAAPNVDGAVYCSRCGQAISPYVQYQPPQMLAPQHREPAFAILLSLLYMGLGQIYNGQTTKGLVILLVGLVGFIPLHLLTCGLNVLLHIPLHVIMVVDALLICQRINRGEMVGEWQFF